MILEIVSPEATIFKGEVNSVTVPGVSGSFEMLNNHAPIVSLLKEGKIKIAAQSFNISNDYKDLFNKENESTYTLSIHSGTIEMKNNTIIVLAD